MIINMNGAKAPETPSPVLQEKTVTPQTLPVVIGADEGYDGLSQVTVNPDAQLIPTNIRSGKTIFGVDGTFVGAESSSQVLKGLKAYMANDGSYVEELRTSTFPEDLGWTDVSPYATIKFLNLGVSVKTLDIDTPTHGKFFVNGGGMKDGSTTKYYPARVKSSTTTSSYSSNSELDGYVLGIPEVPSGGNDRFLASKIRANIVTDGELVIDDTHWFNNESYCGFYESYLRVLNADGTASNDMPSNAIFHFKRNVSALKDYTFGLNSSYSIRFYSETPPRVYGSTFGNNLKQIVVPKGLLETYQNAPGWSNYASKIVEATE